MASDDSGNRTHPTWMDAPPAEWPALDADLETDVCVIGAGVAGLCTAYELTRAGVDVVVLDDGPVGHGETGRSTAHLASALDDRFHELERMHGEAGARIAAESHAAAIARIGAIVAAEGIDCGFARIDAYLWRHPDRPADELERELAAARRAGLRAEMVARAPFGFADTGPAIRFADQGRVDPLRFVEGLARAVVRRGGRIFVRTHAIGISARRVATDRGATVHCRAAVVATHSPISDRVAMHTKQAAYRTYVVAMRAARGLIPDALFWDSGDPYHYIRLDPGAAPGGDDLVLIGGEDHKTGQDHHPEPRWDALERWARERLPVEEVVRRWSGQIIEPADGLAFIGRDPAHRREGRPAETELPAAMRTPGLDPLAVASEPMFAITGTPTPLLVEGRSTPTTVGSAPGTAAPAGPLLDEGVYLCTGDSGNGMTHGALAGMLLRDLILGYENPWAALYEPARKPTHAIGAFARENLNAARQYGQWATPGEIDSVDALAPGAGGILRRGLVKIAVHRDVDGSLHERSATCPHLGCVVAWNPAEGSWDCPCHGSRFSAHGRVVNGPANQDLGRAHAGDG